MKIAGVAMLSNNIISVFSSLESKDNEVTTQSKEDLGENTM